VSAPHFNDLFYQIPIKFGFKTREASKERKEERKESKLFIFFRTSKLITWNKSFEYSLHAGGVNTFTVGRVQPQGDRPCQYILLPRSGLITPKLAGAARGLEEVLIEPVRKQLSFPVPFWVLFD
jgi:hypothetical protein